MENINPNEAVEAYAVFGNPIEHSRSPQIHRLFAEQTQQSIVYDKECIPVESFAEAVKNFFSIGGKGLNVTVPFKEEAFALADELSERAKLACAVNTLSITQDGKIIGDNTDGQGLVNDIVDRLAWQIKDKNILILGAGGAVRGVLHPILAQQPKSLSIANRTIAKAQGLVEIFKPFGVIEAREINVTNDSPYDLIINGTSASLTGDLPPLSPTCVNEKTCVYDMVYAAGGTPFMHWAKEHGATEVADGLGMLVGQAAESFRLWRGVMPEVEPVMAALREVTI